MLRYAITGRAHYSGDEGKKQRTLLDQAAEWIAQGIDFVQLREKDLPARTQIALARKILQEIGLQKSNTRLLVNSRPDVALATDAHGVHLSSHPDELTPGQLRTLYAASGCHEPMITVSCHTLAEVRRASQNRVTAILFGPVFEKVLANEGVLAGQGLEHLRVACAEAIDTPVFALGGVTKENASFCIQTGASGIAGIRLFQTFPGL